MELTLFRKLALGGGEVGIPPDVNFIWGAPNSGVEPKLCTNWQNGCTFQLYLYVTDTDNDVTNIKIQLSQDEGSTWATFQDNIPVANHNFTDSITQDGTKWYRAIAKDSEGHEIISPHILKITKKQPNIGDIVLVYNGIEYIPNPIGDETTVSINISSSVVLALKNRSTSEYILCMGYGPGNTGNSINIHKYGYPNITVGITSSPQGGDIILPTENKEFWINSSSHSGKYVMGFSQAIGMWNNNPLPGSIQWFLYFGNISPKTYFYKSRYQDGRKGKVIYIDSSGQQIEEELQGAGWQNDGLGGQIWVDAPCTMINDVVNIIQLIDAITCVPLAD